VKDYDDTNFGAVESWTGFNVSEEDTLSIFRAEDVASMFLRNVGIYRQVCTAPDSGER
jgi:hypothetical protein